MYNRILVKRFRCLQEVEVSSLGKLNLILGANNVGKTALLEAIWLHHGYHNPELGERIERFRGIPHVKGNEFLHDLFLGFDPSEPIELTAKLLDGSNITLRISRHEIKTRVSGVLEKPKSDLDSEEPDRVSETTTKSILSEIHFECLEQNSLARAIVALDGVHYEHAGIKPTSTAVFLAARRRGTPAELAERFGDVAVSKELPRLTGLLNLLEPRLEDLRILHRGGLPLIYGDVGTTQLVPIALMGDGMGRLLEIALAFSAAKGGLLLVDEIENGLHYMVMPKVWRSLKQLAEAYDVQVFAATHSAECLQAAYEALQDESAGTFVVHRLERVEQGQIRAITLDIESLGAALEIGGEVR